MKKLVLVITTSTVFAGCATYTSEIEDIRSDYRKGVYDKALERIKESDILAADRNRLLLRLESSMVYDRLNDYAKSRKLLLEADQIADELYTTSVSKTAASFLYNDSATDYEGEDYEKVAIHTILALSFIGTGQLNEARVESRKINSKLNEINQRYDEDQRNQYAEDAFARFISGLIYESRGEWDSAIIDFAKALELYAGPFNQFIDSKDPPDYLIRALSRLYSQRGRSDRLSALRQKYPKIVDDELAHLKKQGQFATVAVIHEVGIIAHKEQENFVVPIAGQVVRFSWPVVRKTTYRYGATGISLSPGSTFIAATSVQNLDAIARVTLDDKRLRMIAKMGARLVTKGVLTEQAYRNFGLIGGLAANVYSAVSETADTRSWTTLPQAFYISTARVPPGKYNLSVKTNGQTVRAKEIDVKPNQVLLLRATTG